MELVSAYDSGADLRLTIQDVSHYSVLMWDCLSLDMDGVIVLE